ncbi:MAG: hydroxyacid dehydrogenase [Clostridia bacterium]|nr:hydroxyacid dehydrogenase [Clostridia bacterium]
MKSILMGGGKLFSVYTPRSIETLVKQADLCPTPISREELLSSPEKYRDVEYIFSTWGMPKLSEEEIRTCLPSLRAVFYAAGSVQAFAREHFASGVRVFSAWGSNAVPVAEYTVAQILLANKGFFSSCRIMTRGDHKGAKHYFQNMPGNYGARVGIIGAGMIGKMVIRRLADYRLETVVYDPFLSEEKAAGLGTKKVSLEELFETSQTVSNHVANLPATVGMLNYALFSRMPETATFINTGRGAQVVEEDLIRALRECPTRTAVLDVTYPEPPLPDSPFYSLPNVFLTPHIAGSAGDEVARMGEQMVSVFAQWQKDPEQAFDCEVTRPMLETMA